MEGVEEGSGGPGQEAVLQRVPDVLVDAVADAVELGHVGRHSRVPAHLQTYLSLSTDMHTLALDPGYDRKQKTLLKTLLDSPDSCLDGRPDDLGAKPNPCLVDSRVFQKGPRKITSSRLICRDDVASADHAGSHQAPTYIYRIHMQDRRANCRHGHCMATRSAPESRSCIVQMYLQSTIPPAAAVCVCRPA